ncbi:vesicle-associated membrane protein 8 [Columba livia]|uniref:Vesicle-associated membrane protein 8 n=1 Tax=Columba livia TaxID=8932 RepID=R7VP41_COLLI|nr:vesicle-associated membrane protein 8 [Columba livia]PKK17275.1 vesicle-associated membrane protein 8 [Columba livia]
MGCIGGPHRGLGAHLTPALCCQESGGTGGTTPGGTGSGDSGDRASGRVRALQREVEGVTTIMTRNVEQILARGENLERLHDKSQDLEATSQHFKVTSQKVVRRYWWKNVKLLIILGLVGVIILILIILLATGTIPT